MKLQFIKGALVPADDEARAIGRKHKIGDLIEIDILNERLAAFNAKVFVTLDEIAKMLGITMQALRAEILIETGRAENLKLRDGTRAWALPSMSKSAMTQAELSSFWADAQAYIVKEVLISLDGAQQERVLTLLGVNREGEPVNILQAG